MVLRQHEVRTVKELVADLAEADDLQTYAERAVHGLLALVPTDLSHVFNELRQEPLALEFGYEEPRTEERPDLDKAMAHYWRQSPTSTVRVGTRGGVFRWSDLIARDELERLDIYQLVFCPQDVHHVAKVVFPSGPLESDAFMLARTSNDFSDKDMDVLRTLYPFLLFSYRTVRARAAARQLERALESRGLGVLALRPGGGIVNRSGGAISILRDWFGAVDGGLPSELATWVDGRRHRRPLDSGPPSDPLILRRDGRSLVIRYLSALDSGDPDQLLMEERHRQRSDEVARVLGLTSREIDVLRLVANGMTNRQVAEALFLSHTTVRRHLENVFAKIGVRTRTGAVAKAFPSELN